MNKSGNLSVAVGMIALLLAGAVAQAAEDKPAGDAVGVGGGWSAEVSPDGTTSLSLDANQTKLVGAVNDFFNGLKSLKGRFKQTGADNKVMKGKFMMMRPGKFRFDYARPSLQVIVSDGEYLAIQDYDLQNEDRVALDQTPFRILLRKDVNLMRDAVISEVQQDGDLVLIALRDKSPDAPGKIKLFLNSSPQMALTKWITTDAQGLDTTVELSSVERDKDLPPEKFVIKPVGLPFQN